MRHISIQKREMNYSKTCVKRPLSKRPKNGFQDQLSLTAGQRDCRMFQVEHSAILSTNCYLDPCFAYFGVAVLHRFYRISKLN